MATDVAVVVGNYQGEHLLPDCLCSIERQTQAPAETIVVDGSSGDASVAVAKSFGAVVLERPNRGLGSLYNAGASATAAPYVLFLNNDVALEPTCIERLAAALDADDTRFAADPTQKSWTDSQTIHARTTLARGRMFREYLPGLHLDPVVPADNVMPTVSAHGAAMLVRRRMHAELRGFDETFFLEWEDLDLCWRAWLRGWPSVYVPPAVVRHRVGAVTTHDVAPRRRASSHHNLLRFALKCLPPRVAARVVIGEAARLPRHPAPISRAFLRIVAELPAIVAERRRVGPTQSCFDRIVQLSADAA